MSEQAEKFTPKPWRLLISGKEQHCVTILSNDDTPLASLYFLGSEETYANGYLMTTAPELYEVLKDVAGHLSLFSDTTSSVLCARAQEVLKKVRGE